MATSLPTFEELRTQGMAHISRLAQQTWTDHNPSDPGITLLEQLCFALTDMGYRIQFDMPDHLAAGGEDAYSALFTARQVLTTAPITFDDYRHSLMDLAGIKNAELRENATLGPNLVFAPFSGELLLAKDQDDLLPQDLYLPVELKGLWEVHVEAIRDQMGNPMVTNLHEQLYEHLHAIRSLCTDFGSIAIYDRQPVRVNLGIELGEGVNAEELLADIYEMLDQYISPSLDFFELNNFLQNHLVEEAFEGPQLASGFLDKTQTQKFKKRADLRRSDIIHAIKQIGPQVKAVREMNMALDGNSYVNPAPWIIQLDESRAAFFELQASNIIFYRGSLIVPVNETLATQLYNAKKETELNRRIGALDLPPTLGRDRSTNQYNSIRLHTPELYGVSPAGLSPQADLLQQVSAKQLSAYMLFFEQILANMFEQLAQSWKLFAVNRTDTQSYYGQALDELPALADVYVDEDGATRLSRMLHVTESIEWREKRTNRFLDHLLARFSESLTDYTLLMGGIPHPQASASEVIEDKRAFIKDFPSLGALRFKGADYTSASWGTENISGLKRRIARKLGISNVVLTGLAGGDEGFYVLEHLLLRPRQGDEFQEHALLGGLKEGDPFSLRLSFIFPEEAGRYASLPVEQKKQVKSFVNTLIREETPAHIGIETYWLSPQELSDFENAYQAFLSALAADAQFGSLLTDPHQFALRIARDEILDILAAQAQANSIAGVAYPLRDIPVTEEITAQAQGNPPTAWSAEIQLFYPQKGVTYVLTDRNRRPLSPRIAVSGGAPDGTNAQGIPYIMIPTPSNLNEDQTYWIRAEKNMLGKLTFVYLQTRVRVLIGIAPVMSSAIPPEIDYGNQVVVRLTGTQAGVDYQLYSGNTIISVAPAAGDPLNPVDIPTHVAGGFLEDMTIMIRGSRDSFTTRTDVGSVDLRVRANPNLRIAIGSSLANYGDAYPTVEVESDASDNVTQASVSYRLLMQEVADPVFVHQKVNQPPASEVLEITHAFGTAKLEGITFANWPTEQTDFVEIGSGTVSNDGDTLLINAPGSTTIQEDSRFVVLATKVNHADPVVLHDPVTLRLFMEAVLVNPDEAPTLTLNPSPVASGTRGRVEIANTQPGVKYFLRIGNVDQTAVFHHDQNSLSPRFDGIGTSKIGVDTVVGPPAGLPIAVQTDMPLNATVSADLIAEKIQTGLQVVLGTISLTVV